MKIVKKILIVILVFLVGLVLANYLNKPAMVNVYFTKLVDNKIQIVPVKRQIRSNEDPVKAAMTELLKGTTENEIKSGYNTEIPGETQLLGVTKNNGSIIINLSKDFESGGGSASMVARYNQVAKTAIDAANKKKVYLEIDGKKVSYIGGEGVEIPQPLVPIKD